MVTHLLFFLRISMGRGKCALKTVQQIVG
uniref:Uncharacterized protein n=1 Tax=Arundo donax TaxID=35708 RepID=A0A0A9ABH3_ARUDO